MKTFLSLLLVLFSGLVCAVVPQEIQGTWTPDIEESIVLMEKNMPEMDAAFMRKKYLPTLERTITSSKYTHRTGERKLTADISLKETQGSSYVMVLSNKSIQGMELTFTPREKGGYIMQSQNPADGSGNIVWKKR